MSTLRDAFRCVLAGVPLLLAAQSASAIVTVGPSGSGCQFTKVQDAINYVLGKERNAPNDVDPYIGVAGDNVYNEALVIDSSNVTSYTDPFGQPEAFVQIYGNYDQHCNDVPINSTAKIGAGGGKTGNSVLEIKGSRPVRVILNHLIMTDASGVGAGGGINIHPTAAGYVDLLNIDITGNHAGSGGGIYANGHAPGLTVVLHDGTTIENNTAANDGGGILAAGETFLYATEGFQIVSSNIAGGAGGGIGFTGHGSMSLGGSTQIVGNQAADGGGIYVNADSATNINFYDGVFIAVNTASQNGGGMTIAGQAKVFAQSTVAPTQIFQNRALSDTGLGGGVYVRGPAEMRFTGSVFSNTAGYGGGIALTAGSGQSDDNALVNLFAANSNTPVNVSGNTAYRTGGGIYLKPYFISAFATRARLCASDFRIDQNQAQEGAAIYADDDFTSIFGLDKAYFGSDVQLNNNDLFCHTSPTCSAGSGCNEIKGNVAATADFQPTDGAAVLVQTRSTLTANRVALQQNTGGHVIRVVDDEDKNNFSISMDDCLITDNQTTHELVYLDSNLDFNNCTLSHNSIGAGRVIRVAGDHVSLTKSIIDQNVDTFDFAGNNNGTNRNLLFLLTNHIDSTLSFSPTFLVGTPRFVDVAQRNYRLRADSPGLDATLEDALTVDLDGYPRDVDLPLVPNYFQSPTNQGMRDLGAYELQLFELPPPPPCVRDDTVFCGGFEQTL